MSKSLLSETVIGLSILFLRLKADKGKDQFI